MFKVVKPISLEIRDIRMKANQIYLLTKNSLMELTSNYDIIDKRLGSFDYFDSYNNDILFLYEESSTLIIKGEEILRLNFDPDKYYISYGNESEIYFRNSEEENLFCFNYGIMKTKWVFPQPTGSRFLKIEDLIFVNGFSESSNMLFILDANSGDMFWQLDTLEHLDPNATRGQKSMPINKIFTDEQRVFVQLQDSTLLCLNPESGSILWQNNAPGSLRAHKDKIYGLSGDLTIYDPNTGEVERVFEIDEKLTALRLYPHILYVLKENHLFFHGNIFPSVGIIDLDTGELLWYHKFKFEDGRIFQSMHPPIVTEDRIYVLDNLGTVHVLEREI